jgi:hypothetical protein
MPRRPVAGRARRSARGGIESPGPLSIAIGLTIPIVLMCGAVTSEESGQLPFPLGRYTTVTESEWNIHIVFEGDGTATVEIATWPPGESDRADVEKHEGTWLFEPPVLRLTLSDGEIRFHFDADLSYLDFGIDGSGPGFRTIDSSFRQDLFGCRKFWLLSEIEKIEWPGY